MLSERLNVAFKLFLGLIPIYYGGLIIAALPSTLQWASVAAIVLITLLTVVGWLDLPMQAIWPVFPGALLLCAGALALLLGAPTLGPVDNSLDGVIALFLVAALYIAWGVRATWKEVQFY